MSTALLPPLTAAALTIAFALSAGAQAAAPSASVPSRATLVARLDSIATDFITASPASGTTIAVVSKGDTLLRRGCGERDREKHLAADAAVPAVVVGHRSTAAHSHLGARVVHVEPRVRKRWTDDLTPAQLVGFVEKPVKANSAPAPAIKVTGSQ